MNKVIKIGVPQTLKDLTTEDLRLALNNPNWSELKTNYPLSYETTQIRMSDETYNMLVFLASTLCMPITKVSAYVIQHNVNKASESAAKAREHYEALIALGYQVDVTRAPYEGERGI